MAQCRVGDAELFRGYCCECHYRWHNDQTRGSAFRSAAAANRASVGFWSTEKAFASSCVDYVHHRSWRNVEALFANYSWLLVLHKCLAGGASRDDGEPQGSSSRAPIEGTGQAGAANGLGGCCDAIPHTDAR